MDRELHALGREVTAPEPGDSSLVWAFFALTPLEFSQGQLFHFAVLRVEEGVAQNKSHRQKGNLVPRGEGEDRKGGVDTDPQRSEPEHYNKPRCVSGTEFEDAKMTGAGMEDYFKGGDRERNYSQEELANAAEICSQYW